MRVSRLYVPVPLASGRTLHLDDETAHYIRSVLRLKSGVAVTLFTGEGGEFEAQITTVNRKSVQIEIGDPIDRNVETGLTVNLGLAISRGGRMDFAIQKSVELGVSAITPLITERCVVQLRGNQAGQKQRHWQRIAQNASEQCGRTIVPRIADASNLEDWLKTAEGLRIFLDPTAENTLDQFKPASDKITLLSGPEGGLSEGERQIAVASHFIPIRLGLRILRTETACIAALAAILTLWGDFSSSRL